MALKVGQLVAYLRGDDTHLQRALKRTEAGFARLGAFTGFATLASSAASLSAALAPASGAVLALPSALLVAGAAVGTFAVGVSGVGDALAAAGGDAEEFEEALAGLSPAAQEFARAAGGLKTAFGPVRDAVQERLFEGLGAQIERLSSTALPTLKTGMVGVAGALNTAAASAGDTLANPVFNGTLATVFEGTTQATNTLGRAVGPLLQVLASLAVVGMPLVQRFAEWAAGGIEAAAAFLTSEQGAAKMSDMVERAGEVLAQLGRIAGSLGTALGAIFGAADTSGASLLDTIEQLAARFAEWATSAEGQEQLAAVFELLGQVAGDLLAILPMLGGALSLVAGAFAALPPGAQGAVAQVLAFSAVGGGLISRLGALSGTVRGIGATLGVLGKQITTPTSAFRRLTSSAGTLAARMATTTASVVANGARMAASAVASGARIAATWAMMGLKALLGAAKMAAAWLIGLGPIGIIIAAVAAVVTLIIVYWDEIVAAVKAGWEWVKEATSAAWEWVKSALGAALDWIVGLFMRWHPVGIIISHWDKIKAATSAAWEWVKSKISGLWSGIVSAVTGAAGRVKSVLSSAWSAVKGAVSSAWNSVKSTISNAINRAYNTVRNIASKFKSIGKNIIQGIINGITGAASRLYGKLKDMASSALNAAKSVLGISSPSRVFAREVGRWIPAGVADGIAAARRQLDGAVSGMVPVPRAPVEVAAAGATGATGLGPAVHIEHWHATERVSPAELGEALYGLVTARG